MLCIRDTDDSCPPASTSARTPAVVYSTSSVTERRKHVPHRFAAGSRRRAVVARASAGSPAKSVSVVPIQVRPARGNRKQQPPVDPREQHQRPLGQRRGTTMWMPFVVRIRPGCRPVKAAADRLEPCAGGVHDHARVDRSRLGAVEDVAHAHGRTAPPRR